MKLQDFLILARKNILAYEKLTDMSPSRKMNPDKFYINDNVKTEYTIDNKDYLVVVISMTYHEEPMHYVVSYDKKENKISTHLTLKIDYLLKDLLNHD